ncbi:MAG TPA: hypothetical protein DCZ12_12010, partial [Gammaproteobacteria bacterium]|nr:hypothetical protein [Gammaproteobacteria bacterium]
LITGPAGLTIKLAIDTFLAIAGRIAWPIIIERFVTRLVVAGLEYLASKNTNTLATETARDIRAELVKSGLPKAIE